MSLHLFAEDHSDLPDQDDMHDAADRRDQARQAALDDLLWDEITDDLPCSCSHGDDDHTPGNGCERRWCTCRWWGP